MTAEIAISNEYCVALAADSAVTITSRNDTRIKKIYNGAEKLFALSKHHPVGIMIFGDGSLSSAPWELIIKAYRKHLGGASFATLQEYATDFFSFLEKNHSIITPGMREKSCFEFLCNSVLIDCLDSFLILQKYNDFSSVEPDEYYQDFEKYCTERLFTYQSADFLDNFDHNDVNEARNFCNRYTPVICEEILLKDGKPIPETLIDVVNKIFATALCKKNDIATTSGLVIAGYGDDEYYPIILSYSVWGLFKDKLRKCINADKCSRPREPAVIPFAQDDEVYSFMRGVSPSLLQYLTNLHFMTLVSTLSKLDHLFDDASLAEKITNEVFSLLPSIKNSVDNHIKTHYTDRIMDMVAFLPKQDIAYMAESLVNLTVFKRKISDDSETVGGPIDVAIISKSEGFVWVKRKHYFNKDLNHHFFNRSND
ncbi:hypothetical protein [Providencia huashanensis]